MYKLHYTVAIFLNTLLQTWNYKQKGKLSNSVALLSQLLWKMDEVVIVPKVQKWNYVNQNT